MPRPWNRSEATTTAMDVRRIYDTSYGEEHLHLGIYENDEDTVDEAGQRTVERIASMIHELGPTTPRAGHRRGPRGVGPVPVP